MGIKLQLPKITDLRPRLTVVGVGGAGCNAVNNMIAAGLTGVEFIVANTDAQALAASSAEHRIQLGINLTEGLGAGSRPEIGEAAAEEAIEEIRAHIAGAHMLFVAAGMGGGTGTGAAGVFARTARDMGILTVGIVTKPFLFEGTRRMRIAEAGIAELKATVDTLIVIPNQNLFRIANERTTFAEAFVLADQVLYSGVACIVDLIVKEGLINLDFADVRTIMSGMGTAMMGTGEAAGDRRAIVAAEEAIANPLLDDVTLKGAKGLLLSITGGRDLTLYEVDEAASRVRQEVDPEANIIVGATFDDSLGDRVRVSIVASGMSRIGAADTAGGGEGGGWPRKPAAANPHGQPAAVPPPAAPPLPATSQDLQRRLSEAMQAPPPHPAYPAAQQSHDAGHYGTAYGAPMAPPRSDHIHPASELMGGGDPRSTWQAPGDVTIEEGAADYGGYGYAPPGGSAHGGAPAAPHGVGHASDPDTFMAHPTADIRRPQRRVPDLDEFPDVAQREYRAKAGATHGRSDSPAAHRGSDHGTARTEPRGGLFQRLTGLARRPAGEAGDSRDADVKHSANSGAARGPGGHGERTDRAAPAPSEALSPHARDRQQVTDKKDIYWRGRK